MSYDTDVHINPFRAWAIRSTNDDAPVIDVTPIEPFPLVHESRKRDTTWSEFEDESQTNKMEIISNLKSFRNVCSDDFFFFDLIQVKKKTRKRKI